MNVRIRRLRSTDIEELVQVSLLAWEPVFRSFENVLGSPLYARLYPDWRIAQRAVVEDICRDSEKNTVWVASSDGTPAGFVAYSLDTATGTGEVELLAVHPDYQNRGIGTELNTFALTRMEAGGMNLAVAGTGGDPAHAPARRSYEKAGYVGLPLVRYYKKLGA